MDQAWEKAVLGKVRRRLLPFLLVLYIVNILDRANLAFAGLQMQQDLGLSEQAYAFGAGIFYLGYIVFEVPSNLLLRRFGARRWIARIMATWGLISCATLAVTGPWSLYSMRILLGVAEAGFFPGIVLYLTYWFPARDRAKAVAFFMAASPLSGIIGNPVSGAIMQHLDGYGGLRGWQWLFLLEGLPAVILGVVVLFYLTDRPEQAGWLTEEERNWLTEQLAKEESYRHQRHGLSFRQALADRRVWLLILLYVTIASGSGAFGFYAPKLLKARFENLPEFDIGRLLAIPNACAVVCMLVNGIHSDRTGERRWHVAVPGFAAAAGLALYAIADSLALSLVGLAMAQSGIMCMIPIFWTLPTAILSGVGAAGGIAVINSIGNVGGFCGPNIIGQIRGASGSFEDGVLAVAATVAAGGLLVLCFPREEKQ